MLSFQCFYQLFWLVFGFFYYLLLVLLYDCYQFLQRVLTVNQTLFNDLAQNRANFKLMLLVYRLQYSIQMLYQFNDNLGPDYKYLQSPYLKYRQKLCELHKSLYFSPNLVSMIERLGDDLQACRRSAYLYYGSS